MVSLQAALTTPSGCVTTRTGRSIGIGTANFSPKTCTHIVYAFAVLGEDLQLKAYEYNDDKGLNV